MLTTLSAERIRIVIPDTLRQVSTRWLGPAPVRPTAAPPRRVQLAEGIWVVLERRRARLSPPTWTRQSLCAQLSTKTSDPLFFGVEKREAPGALIVAANVARQICGRCPVEAACLTAALVGNERYGVWGGTSGRQRSKLRARLEEGASVEALVAECLPSAHA